MRKFLVAGLAVLAWGCGSSRVYLNRDVTTAVVFPPTNESKGPNDAPELMWPHIERCVANRGYRLVPRDRVVAFLEAKKYVDSAQIHKDWTDADLAKEFNVDAIVWSALVAWEASTVIISNTVEVKLLAEIHDKAGVVVWSGEGRDGYTSSPSSGKGLLTSMIGAQATNPAKYAPGAAADCFGSLPWAGWDPEAPKTPAK